MQVKREGPTLKQATVQVLADLITPTSVDEIARRVLERYPGTGKNPAKRVRDLLDAHEMVGVGRARGVCRV